MEVYNNPRLLIVDGAQVPALKLTIETERLDVTSALPRPDPRWHHVDSQGHYHARSLDETRPYPTLHIITPTHECGGCDCPQHDETRYACVICGEEVTPGTISAPMYREYVPGVTHWRVEAGAQLPMSRYLSVMLRDGDEVLFGVAVVVDRRYDNPVAGVEEWVSVLEGVSPLGRRAA